MLDQTTLGDSIETGASASATPQEPPHPALDSEISRSLFKALQRKDQETPTSLVPVAPIYLGAKTVRWQMKNPENPEYLAQAAHSVRELFEYLPTKFNIAIFQHKAFADRQRKLIACWEEHGKPDADGAVNVGRHTFDEEMAAFVEATYEVTRTHRTRSEQLIMRMDVSKRPLPPDLANEHIKEWGLQRAFFVDVCHHRQTTSDDEYDARLRRLELFLLDRMRPRVLEDQAPLRAIIERGEASA
jgi:hypothetical protein